MKKDDFSFLGNTDIETIEALYRDYQRDPNLVEKSWQYFFRGFEFARQEFGDRTVSETLDKEFKVINLIDAYRKRGHLFTKTNPVGPGESTFPPLTWRITDYRTRTWIRFSTQVRRSGSVRPRYAQSSKTCSKPMLPQSGQNTCSSAFPRNSIGSVSAWKAHGT